MAIRRKKRRLVVCWLAVTIGVLGITVSSQASSLTGYGTWDLTVGTADLTAGAGTNLTSTYQSGASQLSLDVTGTSGGNWEVDVQRTDVSWPSGLTLSIVRTGDGSPLGTIGGGLSYQEATPTSTAFFNGTNDDTGIPLQLELSGVSVAIPPGSYSTTLVFTVVDLP